MARWNLIDTLPGVHRVFTRPDSSSVYIADNSGQTPDQTEDGVLWLDMTQPLRVGPRACAAPVVSMPKPGQRDHYSVGLTPEDALWLSDRYGWTIKTTGASTYRAVRVTA
jgi:hypothetical protein